MVKAVLLTNVPWMLALNPRGRIHIRAHQTREVVFIAERSTVVDRAVIGNFVGPFSAEIHVIIGVARPHVGREGPDFQSRSEYRKHRRSIPLFRVPLRMMRFRWASIPGSAGIHAQ